MVRALETVTDEAGVTHPGEGWTALVITPQRGIHAVDGLLTGLHEPQATHLAMFRGVDEVAAFARYISAGFGAGVFVA